MVDRDAEGRSRRGVYLPDDLWRWLEATAALDGTSRSDLLEGLVLLAKDAQDAAQRVAVESGVTVAEARRAINDAGGRLSVASDALAREGRARRVRPARFRRAGR